MYTIHGLESFSLSRILFLDFLIYDDVIRLLIEHINLVLARPNTISQHRITLGPKDIAFPIREKGMNKL